MPYCVKLVYFVLYLLEELGLSVQLQFIEQLEGILKLTLHYFTKFFCEIEGEVSLLEVGFLFLDCVVLKLLGIVN